MNSQYVEFCNLLRHKLLKYRMRGDIVGTFITKHDGSISEQKKEIIRLTQEIKEFKEKDTAMTKIIEDQQQRIDEYKERLVKTAGVE